MCLTIDQNRNLPQNPRAHFTHCILAKLTINYIKKYINYCIIKVSLGNKLKGRKKNWKKINKGKAIWRQYPTALYTYD